MTDTGETSGADPQPAQPAPPTLPGQAGTQPVDETAQEEAAQDRAENGGYT